MTFSNEKRAVLTDSPDTMEKHGKIYLFDSCKRPQKELALMLLEKWPRKSFSRESANGAFLRNKNILLH